MAFNVLLSYAFHARTDLHSVRRRLPCGRLLIDSGAFTAASVGKPVRLEEYAEFLDAYRGAWDHAVTLDVIGDPKATARQTRRLHGMGIPVMPVFTRGEALAEFDAMVRDTGYVCVGGGVGLPPALTEKRIALLQRRAEDLGGGIHALGVGAIPMLKRARPYSADASNLSGAFRFGQVLYFDGRRVRSARAVDRPALRAAALHLEAHGIDAAPIIKSGRLPSQAGGRPALMRGMSYAYAAADEYLKAAHETPVPHGVNDVPGTHLYSSLIGEFLVDPTLEAEAAVHTPGAPTPRVWRRYAHHHRHHPGHAAGRAKEQP